MEDLFDECSSNIKYDVPKNMINSNIEKLTHEIENNYRGLNTIHQDRETEKADLNAKVLELNKKLKEIKNPKNLSSMPFARREAINKKLAETREGIRTEIKKHKVRLDEIAIEEGDKTPDKSSKTTRDKDQSIATNTPSSDKWNAHPYSDFL